MSTGGGGGMVGSTRVAPFDPQCFTLAVFQSFVSLFGGNVVEKEKLVSFVSFLEPSPKLFDFSFRVFLHHPGRCRNCEFVEIERQITNFLLPRL